MSRTQVLPAQLDCSSRKLLAPSRGSLTASCEKHLTYTTRTYFYSIQPLQAPSHKCFVVFISPSKKEDLK